MLRYVMAAICRAEWSVQSDSLPKRVVMNRDLLGHISLYTRE
jgi:hypothetical protein